MRTIGLIGGMSWESTVTYYQIINEAVARELGGLHSAKVLLASVDFAEVEAAMSAGRWDDVAGIVGNAAATLEAAGADCVLICTNTVHKVAPQVQARVGVPLLSMLDAVADELTGRGVRTVGLLGTAYTMEQEFYREPIEAAGVAVLTPGAEDRTLVNSVIFDELCRGIVRDESRREFLRIIDDLREQGAEAVILGCTEIPLLVKQEDTGLPLIDTTAVHAQRAAAWALDAIPTEV